MTYRVVPLDASSTEARVWIGTLDEPPDSARLVARPEVKVLCGDQVYLDSPWTHFLWHLHDRDQLEADFFDNYARTWSLGVTPSGFQDFLSSAATYFISDDHEYWNSAPNLAPNIADTWTQARRDAWLAAARRLVV